MSINPNVTAMLNFILAEDLLSNRAKCLAGSWIWIERETFLNS